MKYVFIHHQEYCLCGKKKNCASVAYKTIYENIKEYIDIPFEDVVDSFLNSFKQGD